MTKCKLILYNVSDSERKKKQTLFNLFEVFPFRFYRYLKNIIEQKIIKISFDFLDYDLVLNGIPFFYLN